MLYLSVLLRHVIYSLPDRVDGGPSAFRFAEALENAQLREQPLINMKTNCILHIYRASSRFVLGLRFQRTDNAGPFYSRFVCCLHLIIAVLQQFSCFYHVTLLGLVTKYALVRFVTMKLTEK